MTGIILPPSTIVSSILEYHNPVLTIPSILYERTQIKASIIIEQASHSMKSFIFPLSFIYSDSRNSNIFVNCLRILGITILDHLYTLFSFHLFCTYYRSLWNLLITTPWLQSSWTQHKSEESLRTVTF